MGSEIRLHTDAWHSDREITLRVPGDWEITTYRPDTPAPLSDSQIMEALANPIGEPPIRQLCWGKVRPLIIIDDLNRPTPTDRLLPFVLNEFASSGIAAESVRILLASGAHGTPTAEAVRRKVGFSAAAACRVLLHDSERDCRYIGSTSYRTRVIVNEEVLASDFIVGIGGIYPNHTAGFGGGSKLALGVLGIHSIMQLHYRHASVGWGGAGTNNTFRKDLDEIARMITLRTMIGVHVNGKREVVRMVCGDHVRFYQSEVEYARRTFSAPPPQRADVIISNAYPIDTSLTFARMKGMLPIRDAAPGVSRVAVASCRGGIGSHGLFPIQGHKNRISHGFRLMAAIGPAQVAKKLLRRLPRTKPLTDRNPVWIFRPLETSRELCCPPECSPQHHGSMCWMVSRTSRQASGMCESRFTLALPCNVWMGPCSLMRLQLRGTARKQNL